jgi:FG-GAP-like repeat/FG-GAP repeat
MKRYVVLMTLFLCSLPGFGSNRQPSRSSQFHANKSQASNKADRAKRNAAAHARDGAKRPSASVQRSMNTATKGHFTTRPFGVSSNASAATVSFIAGARTAWGGEDDDETESVLGDFNGDGKMDVAKVTYVAGEGSSYQISVLLGNGDGTFQTAIMTATPSNADDPILVGDVDGDGNDDIIQVHPQGDNCDRAQKAGAQTGGQARVPQGAKPQTSLPCGASIDVLLSNGDGTFAAAVNYPVTGASLQGGLLTDIDGDGKLDILAFDDSTPSNVIEMLGNGDGTFATASSTTTLTTSTPGNMIFADFNGDGKIDFAGRTESGQLQVTLASGAGLFANAPVSLATPDSQYGACNSTAGDLTGDGKPEIVSFNCGANTVTVYVNNGDGTFATGVYYNNNSDQYQRIYDGAIADMNGDGKNDIVAINDEAGDVSVFLGHGDGSVTVEPSSYAVGGYAWYTPLIADFNGDGIPDVVESDDLYNLVYLQGYGDATFRAAPTYTLPNSFDQGAYTYSVASGDFNGDGIPDVVVGQTRDYGSTGVVVYLGKGDGTFHPGDSYGYSPSMSFVAVGDFNGDGKLDIAAIDQADDVLQIFLGNGDGTFSIGGTYPTSTAGNPAAQELVVGDFNKDGKMDIAVANANSGDVGVLVGNGDGTFAAAVSYPITGYAPFYITAADLNGDGYLDLAVTAYTDGPAMVGVLLSNSEVPGTFGTVHFVAVNGNPENIALGDLNKDGKTDMAVTEADGATFDGQIEIFLNDGTGTFSAAPTAYTASTFGGVSGDSYPLDIQMFDMNGDGNLDLVYVNDDYGTVGVALGNGDGTIAAPVEFPTTEYVEGLALADVNGDGAMDVLTGEDEAGGFSVMLNANGTGTSGNYTFGAPTPSATVTAGASATYLLNLAGLNGYSGTITFTCGELPTGATCSFSPASVVSTGNMPLTTTLTITTTAAGTASLMRPALPGSQPGSPLLLASMGGMGLFGLLLAGTGKKGRQRRAGVVLGVMLLLMMVSVVACDSSSSTKASTSTPAGSYTVVVTSTGTGTAAPTHSVNLTMIVQ